MKIAMFTNTYYPHIGGVARSVAILSEDLRRMGHEVIIVAPEFADMNPDDQREQWVYRVPAIQNFNGSDFSVRLPAPLLLSEFLKAFSPHIIHSHHPFLLGDTALRIARLFDLPLIFTHHTLYERYTHYVPLDSEAMQQFAIHLSSEYAKLCDAIVAPSESIAELIKQRGVDTRVKVIPTGVDLASFAHGKGAAFRKKSGLHEDAFVIGHLGRLAEEKNLPYLAQAAIMVLKEHPAARFLLVGEGAVADTLRAQFQAQGVSEQVLMPGNLSGQDLVNAYKAMDLFIFASQTETQGMVLTEAMAAGVPVIALDASGVREVITDQENGRLLPADTSARAFAAAIKQVLSEPERLKQWQGQTRKTAKQFSRQNSATAMAGLYQSQIEQFQLQLSSFNESEIQGLDIIVNKFKTEWELIAEKTRAAVKTVKRLNS